jgi:hypothetical protein
MGPGDNVPEFLDTFKQIFALVPKMQSVAGTDLLRRERGAPRLSATGGAPPR